MDDDSSIASNESGFAQFQQSKWYGVTILFLIGFVFFIVLAIFAILLKMNRPKKMIKPKKEVKQKKQNIGPKF